MFSEWIPEPEVLSWKGLGARVVGRDAEDTLWKRISEDAAQHYQQYVTKDSGQRVDYPSGMRRDVDTGKPRYDLIPRFMLKRLAYLYARGAQKYGEDNYTLADSEEELKRFKASAFRHFMAWIDGENDEDHGAAVFFNIAAAEMVQQRLRIANLEDK